MSNLDLEAKDFMTYNAKLQQKKSKLRKALSEKGKIQKDKKNDFDRYTYLSEAGYKALFTDLFAEHGLELTTTEQKIEDIEATEKQPFGRRATLEFKLTDTETGFYETSHFSGEGFDKGDKGIYKAYTGALKYYFASTFNVATGDDVEPESPDGNKSGAAKGKTSEKAVTAQDLKKLEEQMQRKGVIKEQILRTYHVDSLEKLTAKHLEAAFKTLSKMADIEQEVDINAI